MTDILFVCIHSAGHSQMAKAWFIKDVEDWGLPDPSGEGIEETRRIRDMIAQRVEDLVASL